MISKLYVGNLPFSTTAQELKELFAEVGAVSAVDLILDKFTGRSRGFAFVEMAETDDAEKAIERFHGFEIDGRPLTVNEARPREERPMGAFTSAPSKRSNGGEGGARRTHDFTDRTANSGRAHRGERTFRR